MPYRIFPRRFRQRVGKRGLVLLLFGIAWIVQGSAFFLLADMFSAEPDLFLVDHLPLPVTGTLWTVTGAVSVLAALLHRRDDDTFGFLAASSMPMLLAVQYLIGTVTYAWEGNPLWVLGALSTLVWLPIVMVISVVASWYEPPILGDER